MMKVIMKPSDQIIGVSKRTRPPYMVNSQLKILTPVGTAMIALIVPNIALTSPPAPIVKKWCSQTMNEIRHIASVAITIER